MLKILCINDSNGTPSIKKKKRKTFPFLFPIDKN